jgi:acetoin utilization protein AcuB
LRALRKTARILDVLGCRFNTFRPVRFLQLLLKVGLTQEEPMDSIRTFMTRSPHTIGQEQTLAIAHQVMREHNVRHLPVLEAGKLVGILSQRDLHLIETLRDVDPETTPIVEAMTADVYVTGPNAPLEEVATTMAEHKYGAAVVVDGKAVVGIFTTVDALHALSTVLRARSSAA